MECIFFIFQARARTPQAYRLRMVSYYRTAQKSIPRAIWLGCLGWEATKPESKILPRTLPTAKEYDLAHA